MFAHNAMTTTSSAMILENTHSAKISFSAAGADRKTETGHRRKEKMMAEYIKRKTVINHLDACMDTIWKPEIVALKCFVEGIPAADVAPVRHGRWVTHYRSGTTVAEGYVSTCCDMWNNRKSDFCPNCGAQIDGAE